MKKESIKIVVACIITFVIVVFTSSQLFGQSWINPHYHLSNAMPSVREIWTAPEVYVLKDNTVMELVDASVAISVHDDVILGDMESGEFMECVALTLPRKSGFNTYAIWFGDIGQKKDKFWLVESLGNGSESSEFYITAFYEMKAIFDNSFEVKNEFRWQWINFECLDCYKLHKMPYLHMDLRYMATSKS